MALPGTMQSRTAVSNRSVPETLIRKFSAKLSGAKTVVYGLPDVAATLAEDKMVVHGFPEAAVSSTAALEHLVETRTDSVAAESSIL